MSLDHFIEKCTEVGKVDSEGAFSVDSLAALRKILASALPEPHYYLFQLLQALVKCDAEKVKVAVGRRENRISFTDPNRHFADLESLEARFQKGLSVASDDPLDMLMSGMVTALGCHVSAAELHYGHQKVTVTVNGVKRGLLTRGALTPYLVMRRSLEKGLTYSWSRIWGARKEEFRVRKAFEHSPVSLNIAGLPTAPRSNWRRGFEGDGHLALLEVAILDKEHPNHRGENRGQIHPVEGHRGLFSCEPGTGSEGNDLAVAPNLAMMLLDADLNPIDGEIPREDWDTRRWTICFTNCENTETELLLVRNGLSIVRETITTGIPGVYMVGPADDLEVDASGYKLVANTALAERLQEAQSIVDKVVSNLETKGLKLAIEQAGKEPKSVLENFDWLR